MVSAWTWSLESMDTYIDSDTDTDTDAWHDIGEK